MKKLLLTSAGFSNSNIGEEFLKMVARKPSEVKVLFIPTASEYKLENGDEMFYVKESEKELISLGIPKENIFWLDIKNIQAAGDVENYDVMYVCGGNTFYLMYKLREAGFDKKIIEFVNAGKVYVGVSAGSVIVGPNISIASPFDLNDVELQDMKGLGLTNNIVAPHYQETEEPIISEFEKEHNYKVLRLTNSQAVEEVNGIFKIIE